MAKRSKKSSRKSTHKPSRKNETPKKRKPSKQKNTVKNGARNSRNTNASNRKGKISGKKQHISKPSKTSNKSQSDRGRKVTKTTGKGVDNKRNKSGRLHTEKQKRGSEQLDFSFKNVRSIDQKIVLFENESEAAIKKQLRKRGGKPPRGIIVIVTDKDGNEKAFVSPLDFVVNKDSIKEFINEGLKDMKDNFMAWKGMKKYDRELAKEMKEQGYGDYNPDSIETITIKFIV